MTPREYCHSAAEAIYVQVEAYDCRGCIISSFQDLGVSFKLVQLPDRYRITGDHQCDNCQKARSETYTDFQIASTKQVREC